MKYLLILGFILSLTGLFAQSPSLSHHSFNFYDAPVATTDDYLSPMVNPAAMGRGNSGGFTFMQPYKNDKYLNPYSVYINTGDLAYVIQKENNHLNYNTLAFGGKLVLGQTIPNMYVGMGYDWKNRDFDDGDIRSSWLWAPHNAVSLGFVLTHPNKMAPDYRFGAGIRPLIMKGKVSNRVEFTADMNYAMNSENERGFLKPILGANTEIINGIKIGGSYDMESETYGLTFSFHDKKSATGSRVHIEKHNNYMYDYATASDKVFRTLMGPKAKSAYYELGIKQNIVDQKKGMKFGPFFIVDGKQTAMLDLLNKIKQIQDEPEIGGILFRNANFATSFAHREELIDALKAYKAKGKIVVFYFDNISNANYAFAAAIGDKIYLNPLGTIDLRGIALNSPYLKELADTLGIDFISYQSHKYKSAFNMFTEKEMTPEERIALSSFLSDLYNEYFKMISDGRAMKLRVPVSQLINEGPYFDADRTLEIGMVDQLIYEDQLKDVMKKDLALKTKVTNIEDKIQYDWAQIPATDVALIYATGNIMMGKSSPGKTIGSDLAETIEKARKDSNVSGIILRVDSGGGSAQASDIIANEVKLCKTGKHPKPIVVSMAGAAASGGYYISAFADKIVAEPSTITGSIGVTGLGLHADRMFKKIHVNWSQIKYGDHSDIGSITRKPTEEETEMMRAMTESFYKKFVTVCATGRKMAYDDVDAIAQGRIWTGNQAIANGLIDELGGLDTAIAEMKKLTKAKGDIHLVEYQRNGNSMEVSIGISARSPLSPSMELPAELGTLQDIVETWQQYKGEKCLMLTPFDLTQWNK